MRQPSTAIRRGMSLWMRFCLGLLAVGACTVATAHKGSDAYLDVQEVAQVAPADASAGAGAVQRDYRFSLSVAIKDLDLIIPMDANADGKVTWGEIKVATPAVLTALNQAANVEAPSGSCSLSWEYAALERRSDGSYVQLLAKARCPAASGLVFKYTLFKEQDANHRLLVAGRIADKDLLTTTSPQQTAGLLLSAALQPTGAGTTPSTAQPKPPSGRLAALSDYFSLGVHHLLEGYDHMAFLLALVLPLQLVLRFNSHRALHPAPAAPRAQGNVWIALLRTITAFTIGHSITLMLATFGFTQGSPAWVEPVIALSIGVTAFLNLRPVAWIRTDVLALVFGLVHGYGFAGLLLEAAAPAALLPWALAGFNLGVEAGQLIAVTGWVLLSQLVVNQPWYQRIVVRGGSAILILLAAWWFWQRVS